jgi:hypothetical protein
MRPQRIPMPLPLSLLSLFINSPMDIHSFLSPHLNPTEGSLSDSVPCLSPSVPSESLSPFFSPLAFIACHFLSLVLSVGSLLFSLWLSCSPPVRKFSPFLSAISPDPSPPLSPGLIAPSDSLFPTLAVHQP